MNKVNLSRFSTQNLFQIRACVISARKAKHLDVTSMFTYSHANRPLGQSGCGYYLSYFINAHTKPLSHAEGSTVTKPILVIVQSTIYRDFIMLCLYYFTEILQCPPFTILQRFYGDEMTKDNLYE